MSENVSDEALVMSESGSSYRSSIQVPPLTAVPPPGGGVPGVGAPQALSTRISNARKENAIIRDRGFGLLSIISSFDKKTNTLEEQGCPQVREPFHMHMPGELPPWLPRHCVRL